jgi:hypothetical protein
MSRPSSAGSPDSLKNSVIVLAMLAMIAVPAGLALRTVRVPVRTEAISANATPYGYIVSLRFSAAC